MAPELTARVPGELAGERFDVALAKLSGLTRSQAQIVIRQGTARLGGHADQPSRKVSPGEEISWPPREPEHLHALPQDLPLAVVFEDEHLMVVMKPRGQVVHPAAGHRDGTLVNAVLHHVGELPGGDEMRPGIVHRLDKDTSGLMLVAKSEVAFRRLQRMIAARAVHRTYDALVYGTPKLAEGTVDRPIGRRPGDRQRFGVVEGGREAVTHWRLRESFGRESWLRLELETGRTHQIRVHLQSIGLPVVGDPVYGRDPRAQGQLLHAVRLSLQHPVTLADLTFFAPWPQDMLRRLEDLCRAQHLDFGEVVERIGREDS
jgi:23S rRNA pseudouridine1911/1915/1917 synthase